MAPIKVVHNSDCKRVFSRYDMACPRCQELASGQAPRRGWGPSRAERDARACAEISAHFSGQKHLSGGCGPVCTFGEW